MPFLPLAAGLACAEAIRSETGIEIDLRWPNDLLIGERKAGGILVESKTEGAEVSFAVVGIGINVHQRSFDHGLSTQATSLDIEAGQRISRQALLVALLKSLEREMALFCRSRRPSKGFWRVSSGFQRGYTGDGLKCTALRHALESPQVSMRTDFCWCARQKSLVTVQTGGIRAAEMELGNIMLLAVDVGNTNTVLGLYRLDGEAGLPPKGAALRLKTGLT